MTSSPVVSEVAAREAFVTVWWGRYRDQELSIDEILPFTRAVDGLGFGKGRTRVHRKRLSKLLEQLRGQEIGGHRVTPNRTLNGIQMWRLIRIRDLRAERIAAWDAFNPSPEWQDLPDGYPCPPGVEWRTNLTTGTSQVRWPEMTAVSGAEE